MLKRTHIRVLSLVLVLSMMFTVMPASSAAAGQETLAVSEAQRDPVLETEPLVLDEKSVPEIVGIETALERDHVLRMHEEEQGQLNKLVFLNADGSRTMYLYDHPVKYVDEEGTVKDISLEIADTGDAAHPFRTASGSAVTTFSASLSDGITLSGNSNTLRLVPITGGRVRTASRLDSGTIQYPYGTHTTIEYSLTYTGFKEDIVVSQYTGQTEYSFTLYTNGLTLTEIDGSWYLTDGEGNIQATIGDIIIFTADERNNTLGQMEAETVRANQEYNLTIVLDPEYLADPKTAYPIRIDPTIELYYEQDSTGAIVDLTVCSAGTQSGSSGSLYIGKRENYGTCRALMKFPGLDLSDVENGEITSAKLELRDLLCESAEQDIECYVFNGNEWTESSTWSSAGAGSLGAHLDTVTFGYEIGVEFESKHRYSFDITDAVQSWVSDATAKSKGILFKATDALESGSANTYRTIASYNRSSNKPSLSVTFNYIGDGITSATGKNYVVEGSTLALTANGMDGTVTWTSSNPSIATVSSNGVVTGKLAGSTIITASCPDYEDARFTVWVTVPDGVYYIKNASSGLCLSAGGTASIQPQVLTESARIPQLWKISYIYEGYYAIRPLRDFSTALAENSSSYAGTVDATANNSVLPTAMRWRISHNAFGYYFALSGSTADTLMPITASAPGSSVHLGTWGSNLACHWILTKITGVFLRDTSTQEILSDNTTRYIELNDTVSLAELNIGIECYGSLTGGTTWAPIDSSIVSVDAYGSVTGLSIGETSIHIIAQIEGTSYSSQYQIIIVAPHIHSYEMQSGSSLMHPHLVTFSCECGVSYTNYQLNPTCSTCTSDAIILTVTTSEQHVFTYFDTIPVPVDVTCTVEYTNMYAYLSSVPYGYPPFASFSSAVTSSYFTNMVGFPGLICTAGREVHYYSSDDSLLGTQVMDWNVTGTGGSHSASPNSAYTLLSRPAYAVANVEFAIYETFPSSKTVEIIATFTSDE